MENRLYTGLVFTDNRRWSTDNESETAIELRPGVSFDREGARARLNLDYDLGIYQGLQGDSGTRFVNLLDATLNSELYENSWFLDAQGRCGS